MNTLRTHVKNLVGLLKTNAQDKANAECSYEDFVDAVDSKYRDSEAFTAVETAAAEKLSAKEVKRDVPKVYPLDADGNEIKPKRGRPKGSRNRVKEPDAVAVEPVSTDVPSTSTPVVPAVPEGPVTAEA